MSEDSKRGVEDESTVGGLRDKTPGTRNITVPKFIGGCEIIKALGAGGMGAVFLAKHKHLNREVALKVIRPELIRDEAVLLRFEREMRSIGGLQHENILFAYDAGVDDDIPYLVTELVDGVDAQHLIETEGRLPIAEAAEIVRQALLGIDHAAAHGIVHRDVKPANLLIAPNGRVKVADLGVARLNDSGEETLTTNFSIVGTPDFLSPEQARGEKDLTSAADVYALGCTLYYFLAGKKPFSGEAGFNTPLKKVRAHDEKEAAPITDFCPDLPAGLVDVVGRMMAKEAENRGPNPTSIAVDLTPFAEGADLQALVERASKTQGNNDAEKITITWAEPKTQVTSNIPSESDGGRRRRMILASLIGVPVIAAVALLVFAMLAPQGGTPHFGPEATDGWEEVALNRATEILRKDENETRNWSFDKEAGHLIVNSTEDTFVRLGSVEGAEFEIRILFYQGRWTGNVGLYFGGDDGTPTHAIMVTKLNKNLALDLCSTNFKFVEGATVEVTRRSITRQNIPAYPEKIEIVASFADRTLKSIRQNGAKLNISPSLLSTVKASGRMSFGLYAARSAITCEKLEILAK